MRKRRLSVIVVALIMGSLTYFCSTFVLPLPEAQAQAYVIGSDPIDGSTINALPSIMRIFFNAPISPISTAHIYVVENNGLADVGASSSSISASARELDIPLKTPRSQPQGSYEVRWMAVANDDGHTTYGLIGFNVGVSSNGLSGTPTLGPSTSNALSEIQDLNTISILAIAWEWLGRIALALWIGILVIERFVLAGSEQTMALVARIKRQTYSLQWLCLGTLFVGELVTLILRSSNLTQASNLAQMVDNGGAFSLSALPQLVIGTNYGRFWLLRIALIAGALGLLYWMRLQQKSQPSSEVSQRVTSSLINRTGPLQRITQDHALSTAVSLTKERLELEQNASTSSRVQRLLSLWLLLAALIVLTQALSDDVASQLHISTIVFDWLYRMVEGAWFGGVAYLAYVVFPFLPKAELEHRAEVVALLLGRFVPYLLSCAGIILVCALFFAEASLSSIQQFLNDPYGRALCVQLILIALASLMTFYALFIVRPRFTHQALSLPVVNADLPARRTRQSALEQTWHRLKQVMNMQALLGAGILLCSAFMTFYAPPIVFPNIHYSNSVPSVPASTTPVLQTKQVGDLSLTLQILPGKVNSINTVILLITDRSSNPVKNAKVSLVSTMQAMNMGITHKTLNSGNPVYAATFAKNQTFSMAGVWLLNVTIQRPKHPSLQTTFQFNVT